MTSNETLYVNNLCVKVRKGELIRSLYLLFSQYGTVVDVVCMKSERMRGQAFIVFKSAQASQEALRRLRDVSFYGKPLHIFIANKKSFVSDPSERLRRDSRRAAAMGGLAGGKKRIPN
eukprot:Tbor_TRINITY_DN4234_c0_g1::TRINITY_DN4234_c0_g1_i1::g.23912::m.23912/K11094/SNRPB2; U2 small nuclear ribonucleoprotein B''